MNSWEAQETYRIEKANCGLHYKEVHDMYRQDLTAMHLGDQSANWQSEICTGVISTQRQSQGESPGPVQCFTGPLLLPALIQAVSVSLCSYRVFIQSLCLPCAHTGVFVSLCSNRVLIQGSPSPCTHTGCSSGVCLPAHRTVPMSRPLSSRELIC